MGKKIRKAAIIGSGVMGGGIAALLAGAGVKTLLLDIVPSDLKDGEKNDPEARNRISATGLDAVKKSKPPLLMHKRDADLIEIGNTEDDFDKLAECDWIVEAVVEDLKIKQDLLKRIESVRKADTAVSTNTSGIPLRAMSEGLSGDFRKHFLGTHFFNPVRYMKLLEIIPGEETLPEVLKDMADFGERVLGKGIVWARDTPNFIGNRIAVRSILNAMRVMLEDGLTIPEADAILGRPMGRPKTAMFKTIDLVGLDIMAHVAANTYNLVTDDEQRDSFKIPDFVGKMIENRLLGKKTGAGFYKKEKSENGKTIRKVIDPKTMAFVEFEKSHFPCLHESKKAKTVSEKFKSVVYGNDRGAKFAWKATAGDLIYSANRIPEISDTVVDIDNAMKWGYNYDAGPFETWDAIGLSESVRKMEREGMEVPENIRQMLADGNTSFYKTGNGKVWYYDFAEKDYKEKSVSDKVVSLSALKGTGKAVKTCDSASLVDIGDGVFNCEFHTKMNTLNTEIIDFMNEAFDYVDENGIGLVIGNQAGGMPGAFSAGADLKSMGQMIMTGRLDKVEEFLEKGQDTSRRARYSNFPVVAAPYGITLGGGCEVCLGADRIVAHAELYMGLVEIGVGLLPAGGGCLNLWKKYIESIPESVADFDLTKLFIPAFMNIAMAKVSSSAADARTNGFLGPKDRIVFNRDHLIGEAKREVLNMVDQGYAPPVKRKIKVAGDAVQGMINSELHNMLCGKFVSEYDVYLAKRIAYVMSGGDVRAGSEIDEDVILKLEREAFVEFLRQQKTLERAMHMMQKGKPLRN